MQPLDVGHSINVGGERMLSGKWDSCLTAGTSSVSPNSQFIVMLLMIIDLEVNIFLLKCQISLDKQ